MKTITCIICPRGCAMSFENGTVTGNACSRGKRYAIEEVTSPTRSLTTVLRVSNRTDTMVSVKTSRPIPKDNILDAMQALKTVEVTAPILRGDILLSDIFGVSIVATKSVP